MDAATFFRELPHHFSDAATLFVEGSAIGPDVAGCYVAHAEPGLHLPGRHTLWPKAALFRCKFSIDLCATLAQLSGVHAVPEICDHLFVYEGTRPLLEFPDFCHNQIILPIEVAETEVAAFASVLGLKYLRCDDG